MGGYIAFEIIRQAPERVSKLALLELERVQTHRCRPCAVTCSCGLPKKDAIPKFPNRLSRCTSIAIDTAMKL